MTTDNGHDTAGKPPAVEGDESLSRALENTLDNLNVSIERMEEIVRRFEAGDEELDDSIRLLAEANELAVSSSKELDQAVQKVLYKSDEAGSGAEGKEASDTATDEEGSRET